MIVFVSISLIALIIILLLTLKGTEIGFNKILGASFGGLLILILTTDHQYLKYFLSIYVIGFILNIGYILYQRKNELNI